LHLLLNILAKNRMMMTLRFTNLVADNIHTEATLLKNLGDLHQKTVIHLLFYKVHKGSVLPFMASSDWTDQPASWEIVLRLINFLSRHSQMCDRQTGTLITASSLVVINLKEMGECLRF
jgi:hypothetical protein